MSRHGDITLPWGDGEYTFRLAYGQWLKVQEACDAGPPRIAARLRPYDPVTNPHGDNYKVQDIVEPIRQGLIGSKTPNVDMLVRKYVLDVPWEDNRLISWLIIAASVSGSAEEETGKALEPETETTKASGSPMTKSPSEESTELVLQ